MGLALGNYNVQSIKLGEIDVNKVFLGAYLVWPPEIPNDINIDELIQVLSCYSFGHWEDILPWNDNIAWVDNIT